MQHRLRQKIVTGWIAGFFIVLVTGCGFHLRGTGDFELNESLVQVVSETPYNELERKLKQQLLLSGAKMTTSLSAADLQIRLIHLEFHQTGASRDETGRANEIILRAELDYQLISLKNSVIKTNEDTGSASKQQINSPGVARLEEVAVKKLRVSRSFYQNYQNPVGERNQLKDTQDEIYSEMVILLTRQLQTIASH